MTVLRKTLHRLNARKNNNKEQINQQIADKSIQSYYDEICTAFRSKMF